MQRVLSQGASTTRIVTSGTTVCVCVICVLAGLGVTVDRLQKNKFLLCGFVL